MDLTEPNALQRLKRQVSKTIPIFPDRARESAPSNSCEYCPTCGKWLTIPVLSCEDIETRPDKVSLKETDIRRLLRARKVRASDEIWQNHDLI